MTCQACSVNACIVYSLVVSAVIAMHITSMLPSFVAWLQYMHTDAAVRGRALSSSSRVTVV